MKNLSPNLGSGFIGASTIADEHMVRAVRASEGNDVVAVMSANAEHCSSIRIGASHCKRVQLRS
jgi:predicted dehydrogenase